MAYSTNITSSQQTTTVVAITEDVLFNNKRVGGVQATMTVRNPDGVKAWTFNVVSNTGTNTALDQEVDLLFGGQVVGRLSVMAQPDATLPSGHSIDIETNWSRPVPADVVTQILA